MSKSISEFKSEAGRIYIEKTNDEEKPYEVWFEDFCIFGLGTSPLAALQDAKQHAENIAQLIGQAITATIAAHAGGGE